MGLTATRGAIKPTDEGKGKASHHQPSFPSRKALHLFLAPVFSPYGRGSALVLKSEKKPDSERCPGRGLSTGRTHAKSPQSNSIASKRVTLEEVACFQHIGCFGPPWSGVDLEGGAGRGGTRGVGNSHFKGENPQPPPPLKTPTARSWGESWESQQFPALSKEALPKHWHRTFFTDRRRLVLKFKCLLFGGTHRPILITEQEDYLPFTPGILSHCPVLLCSPPPECQFGRISLAPLHTVARHSALQHTARTAGAGEPRRKRPSRSVLTTNSPLN